MPSICFVTAPNSCFLHVYYARCGNGRPKAVDSGRRPLASMALVVSWPVSAVIDNVPLVIGAFQHGGTHV